MPLSPIQNTFWLEDKLMNPEAQFQELVLAQTFQSLMGGSVRDFSRTDSVTVYRQSAERVMRDEGLFLVYLPEAYSRMDSRASSMLDLHIATAIAGIHPAVRSIGSVNWGVDGKAGAPTFVFEVGGTLVSGMPGVGILRYSPSGGDSSTVFQMHVAVGDPDGYIPDYQMEPFDFRSIAKYGQAVQEPFETVALRAVMACYGRDDAAPTMFSGGEDTVGIFIRANGNGREIIFQHAAVQGAMVTLARVVFRPDDDVQFGPSFNIRQETVLLGDVHPSGSRQHPTQI